jgi:serine protease AprX
LTAGAVAVVREYLRKTVKIASPSAALLKAALIAGAQPVRPAAVPPDNDQGFGRVNLDNLLSPPAPLKAAFIEGKGLATGSLDERAVTVAQGGQPLKIVLAYSDFPGPRLVNNLNLIVRGPTGAVIQVGNAGAGNSFDTKNKSSARTCRMARNPLPLWSSAPWALKKDHRPLALRESGRVCRGERVSTSKYEVPGRAK